MVARRVRHEITIRHAKLTNPSEPRVETIGLLKPSRDDGQRSLQLRIDFGVDIWLKFNSKRELDEAKQILKRYIGRVVGIFSDDEGIPHIRLISQTTGGEFLVKN